METKTFLTPGIVRKIYWTALTVVSLAGWIATFDGLKAQPHAFVVLIFCSLFAIGPIIALAHQVPTIMYERGFKVITVLFVAGIALFHFSGGDRLLFLGSAAYSFIILFVWISITSDWGQPYTQTE